MQISIIKHNREFNKNNNNRDNNSNNKNNKPKEAQVVSDTTKNSRNG